MVRKLWSLIAVVLLTFCFATFALADEIKGKITKVGGGGREITVKAKDKEVTLSISGSRTTLEGIGDRSEFKEGQSVTATYEGKEASKVKVTK